MDNQTVLTRVIEKARANGWKEILDTETKDVDGIEVTIDIEDEDNA